MKPILDEMPVNDVIAIYKEKHHALCHGDIVRLIELKKECPEIFDKEKDCRIRDLIQHAKAFQESHRYGELKRQAMKEKLTIIKRSSIVEGISL